MVKRKEFRKRSRYLAMLTALSLAFSNVGSCVNMVYAAEAEAEDTVEQSENEENSGEENADEKSDEESGDVTEEGGSEGEVGEEENSEEEGADGSENSKEEGSDSSENTEGSEDKGDTENGENNSEENVPEEGENKNEAENKADEQSGAEEEKNTVSEDGGSENSEDAVKEASEAKKGTYDLKYSVDPDEGAKIEGPSSVAAGKSAVFTVEAQDGYVIKNVSCESAEISTVEDVDTASASNAQKENAGKNDGEKFQTYQIESVEADAEIIIEMDNASDAGMLLKNKVEAGTVVTPGMSQEQINAAVKEAAESENKVLEVQAGDYSDGANNHKKVIIKEAGMTVQLQAGDYTRAQIITREDAKVVLEGDVTFEGEAKETNNTAAAVFVEQGTLTFDTDGHTMTVSDYTNGLRVGYWMRDSRCTGDAEFYLVGGGTFDIEESVKTPDRSAYADDDAFPKESGVKGSGIALLASENYQRLLTVDGTELKSNKNQENGIYRHNSDNGVAGEGFNQKMGPVTFENGSCVYLDDNKVDGFYDEASSITEATYIVQVLDSYLSLSRNGVDGYTYTKVSKREGRNHKFVNSEIHMDENGNTNASFASHTTILDNTTFTANNSKDSIGIMQIGGLKMTNGSVIEANNNPYGGVWIEYDSEIDNSKVVANKNGGSLYSPRYMSGIYLTYGDLSINNSVLELKDNPSAITIASPTKNAVKQYGNNVIAVQAGDYDTAAETGDKFADKNRNSRNDKFFGRDYVLGGSFQATTANMRYGDNLKGMQFAELNPVIGSEELNGGENYAAPINTDHTALTRFDLHQSANKEAASDENEFVYHDPNTNAEYTYSFRYNTADEDLNGTGGNAYVWAPVSVLHYDATEGKINSLGTAETGNVALVNTRGDGSAVGNSGNSEQTTDRYATDYTIFGNSMNLTEGELPAAVRDGYKFAGWYVADNEGAAGDYAASGNWAELNKLLNTRFTADSKVSEDITDVAKGQEEKTIYAKWVLPSQYNIVINYIDESTGAHISASYNSDYIEEGSSYDVASLLNKAIDGYTWNRYEGGQPTGSLDSDLVFNVYYNSNTPAPTPTPTPTPNRGSSSGSGGGSSTGRHASITTNTNAGPGVTITEENVPLADLPTDTVSVPENIPEEDVPLASLPKTGQSAGKEIALFVSAFVLGAAGIFKKKTKED